MARPRDKQAGRAWLCALITVAVAAGFSLPSLAAGDPDQTLSLALSGLGAEQIKTVPITKKRGLKPRSVMSLKPSKVGRIRSGDSIWAGGEVELSVTCLERMPKCVGKIYAYSPHFRTRLVLVKKRKQAKQKHYWPITGWRKARCSQKLPNRNHHCVSTISGKREVANADQLPCDNCRVSMIVDAYHSGARKGNVLVVGADDDNRISQNKGTLTAGVFSPGPALDADPLVQKSRSRSKLAVGGPGNPGPKKVLYSHRLPDLKRDEQLIVEAQAKQKIKHLGYSVLMQSQLIVSEKPNSIKRSGTAAKVTSSKGVITAQNGFNCTPGSSGHSSPCKIKKVGVVKLLHDARTKPLLDKGPAVPLYINLVVQNRHVGVRGGYRGGDAAKVARKGGSINVYRYGPEYR